MKTLNKKGYPIYVDDNIEKIVATDNDLYLTIEVFEDNVKFIYPEMYDDPDEDGSLESHQKYFDDDDNYIGGFASETFDCIEDVIHDDMGATLFYDNYIEAKRTWSEEGIGSTLRELIDSNGKSLYDYLTDDDKTKVDSTNYDVAYEIKQFCLDNGYKFRDDYVGRGCYEKCIGIVCDEPNSTLVRLFNYIIKKEITYNITETLGNSKIDNMGKQYILYFPEFKFRPTSIIYMFSNH